MTTKNLKIGADEQAIMVYADIAEDLATQLCEHIGADPDADPLIRKTTVNWDSAGNLESIDVEYFDQADVGTMLVATTAGEVSV